VCGRRPWFSVGHFQTGNRRRRRVKASKDWRRWWSRRRSAGLELLLPTTSLRCATLDQVRLSQRERVKDGLVLCGRLLLMTSVGCRVSCLVCLVQSSLVDSTRRALVFYRSFWDGIHFVFFFFGIRHSGPDSLACVQQSQLASPVSSVEWRWPPPLISMQSHAPPNTIGCRSLYNGFGLWKLSARKKWIINIVQS